MCEAVTKFWKKVVAPPAVNEMCNTYEIFKNVFFTSFGLVYFVSLALLSFCLYYSVQNYRTHLQISRMRPPAREEPILIPHRPFAPFREHEIFRESLARVQAYIDFPLLPHMQQRQRIRQRRQLWQQRNQLAQNRQVNGEREIH